MKHRYASRPELSHPWELLPDEAIRVQRSLRAHVQITPLRDPVSFVGGVDVAFPRGKEFARAAVVVMDAMRMEVVDQARAEVPLRFPYIPGLLSFREAPAILAALETLRVQPDALLVDGHGLAHPRRFGLASHLGVLLDLPTVGCAKSILVGSHGPLGAARGNVAELLDGDEVIGAALRTRTDVKPVYVSVGHRLDLPGAVRLVLDCGRGYRLPEPARLADKLA